MKFIFLFLCCLIEYISFGQKKTDEFSSVSNTCNISIASIDPAVFVIDTLVLKRETPKAIKRRLKLGING